MTQNIGDEIQSVAASRLLPRVDTYVDREAMDEISDPGLKLVLNGWFCHRPDKWPPSPNLRPLLISMHFTNNPEPVSNVRAQVEFAKNPSVLDYLSRHGPVGARDTFTYDWLKSQGVACYYSGCLTLTLDRPDVERQDLVVLNDLPEAVADRIESLSERPVQRTTHFDAVTRGTASRMRRAEQLLELYARASCLVTSRLHGALPALAMGTPVLLVDHYWDQSRFSGLNELVWRCTADEFLTGQVEYNVNDPPANPRRHIALRELLKEKVADFVRS